MPICVETTITESSTTTTVVTAPWVAKGTTVIKTGPHTDTTSTCKCPEGQRIRKKLLTTATTTSTITTNTSSAEQKAKAGTDGIRGTWTSTTVTERTIVVKVYEYECVPIKDDEGSDEESGEDSEEDDDNSENEGGKGPGKEDGKDSDGKSDGESGKDDRSKKPHDEKEGSKDIKKKLLLIHKADSSGL